MKRDDRVFSDLWSNVITPQIDELCKKDRVSCPDYNDARERVWNSYCAFNWNYSNRYLEVRDGELDRHKVAACYMCAILDALPLLVDIEDPNEDREAYLSNERLAICVGVSVLGMFECANLEGLQSRLDGLINEGCSERDLERIPIAERNPVYLVRAEMDEVAANIERGIDFRHVFPSPGGATMLQSPLVCALPRWKKATTSRFWRWCSTIGNASLLAPNSMRSCWRSVIDEDELMVGSLGGVYSENVRY